MTQKNADGIASRLISQARSGNIRATALLVQVLEPTKQPFGIHVNSFMSAPIEPEPQLRMDKLSVAKMNELIEALAKEPDSPAPPTTAGDLPEGRGFDHS